VRKTNNPIAVHEKRARNIKKESCGALSAGIFALAFV